MPTVSDTYIENRNRVQPNHTNNYETVHGGNLVKWMDEVGAMSAMRFAGETCVTAGVEDLSFRRPLPIGDIARVVAFVYQAGDREETTESYFVFVAVDADGSTVGVPELEVGSERCERLREEALANEPD